MRERQRRGEEQRYTASSGPLHSRQAGSPLESVHWLELPIKFERVSLFFLRAAICGVAVVDRRL
jgi:hypothetical protein